MEITRVPFEVNRYRKTPMPCFIRGCENQSEHLAKFNYGDVVVQICLSEECLNKSPEFILKGLGCRSDIKSDLIPIVASIQSQRNSNRKEVDQTGFLPHTA